MKKCPCVRARILAISLLPALAVSAGTTQAAALKTLLSFSGSNDGQWPYGTLTSSGGSFYGTTSGGGTDFAGTVFELEAKSGATRTLYAFKGGADGAAPNGSIISVGGLLYGTTTAGGSNNSGTVFRLDPATGAKTTLWNFTGGADGAQPYAGLTEAGGFLFGVTLAGGASGEGTVFKIDPHAGTEAVLHAFGAGADGKQPYGPMIFFNGALYGTTSIGGTGASGTVFGVDPNTGAETVLYNFSGGNDGYEPLGALVAAGGRLYGTTVGGGVNGWGTVFSIVPRWGPVSTVYSFTGGADGGFPYAGLISYEGELWGTAAYSDTAGGSVFMIDPMAGTETTLYDFRSSAPADANGLEPIGGLAERDGVLYGVAAYGGAYGGGTAFSINVGTRDFQILHAFSGAASGDSVNSGLIEVGGDLYGTSALAGSLGQGSVFKIRVATGQSVQLHAFTGGSGGSKPYAALTDAGGTLYGATSGNPGTIFKINRKTGATATMTTFNGNNEGNPEAPLIDVAGTLYGTTFGGYGGEFGTIFSVNPVSGQELMSFTFNGHDGDFPKAALTAVNGVFYGTTSNLIPGSGVGTIFAYDPTTRTLTTLHTFDTNDGANPEAAMILLDGVLYGTTSRGGLGNGTVFTYNPTSGQFATLHAFAAGDDGAFPLGGLAIQGGKLIGTASAGGKNDAGTVYRIDPATGAVSALYSFIGGPDGRSPQCTPLVSRGVIYGTTSLGGSGNRGTVFSLTP